MSPKRCSLCRLLSVPHKQQTVSVLQPDLISVSELELGSNLCYAYIILYIFINIFFFKKDFFLKVCSQRVLFIFGLFLYFVSCEFLVIGFIKLSAFAIIGYCSISLVK